MTAGRDRRGPSAAATGSASSGRARPSCCRRRRRPASPRLWELVDDGAGFDETLDALISAGLRELPGFVLVSEQDDETKVVIRGAARVHLAAGDEVVHVEGDDATTWVERSVAGVTRVRIEVADEARAGEPSTACSTAAWCGSPAPSTRRPSTSVVEEAAELEQPTSPTTTASPAARRPSRSSCSARRRPGSPASRRRRR